MKNLEFTPGSWQIHPDYGQDTLTIVGDLGLEDGCKVTYQEVATVLENKHMEGNSRLIAAAPDMYLLLKHIKNKGCIAADDFVALGQLEWVLANIER